MDRLWPAIRRRARWEDAILGLIVFTSGGVLLALEIVASRIIAPYFGNSIYVWGSLIGVFLAALSTGYFVGGRLADRWPSPALLAGLVSLAGALVVPIPVVSTWILTAIAQADLGPHANPLVASLALFFPPAIVMGTVSPFAVRLHARTVATIGSIAGQLYALSTVGSIAGTLLAAFVLLSVLDVRAIHQLLGGALLVLGIGTWVKTRRLELAASAAIVVLLVGGVSLGGPRALPESVRFEQDTVYHRITVSDEGGVRYLKLDNYWQSGLDLTQPRRTVFAYADYMHLPLVFSPQAHQVLMIGLGGGTVPTRYAQDYASMAVEVVELDPRVLAVAKDYFNLPSNSRVHVAVQDGRLFLTRSRQRYDIILLDAYLIDTIPFHLATREFWETAKMHLDSTGVVAWNVIGALAGPRSGLFRAIYRTFRAVFPTVYVFPVEWGRFGGREALRNIIILGTAQGPLSPTVIAAAADRVRRGRGVTVERFEEAAHDLYTDPIPTDDVPALSDDFAPVDTLLQRR